MVEKNLYVTYADGSEELLKDQSIKENPVAFVYQVKSDYPVDFQNPFLQSIAKDYPEAAITCVHLNEQGIPQASFDWRIKKAFIDTTQSLKTMSHCTRLKVCCLIVKNNRIISTGVNGTPKGFKNCDEVFSPTERLTKGYYERHHQFSEAYEVHAEMNAVLELGRNTSIDNYENLELYCSTCPCAGCAKMIAQSGIKKVFYAETYDRMPDGAKNLQDFGIEVYKI
jgi:dCMP deaminase